MDELFGKIVPEVAAQLLGWTQGFDERGPQVLSGWIHPGEHAAHGDRKTIYWTQGEMYDWIMGPNGFADIFEALRKTRVGRLHVDLIAQGMFDERSLVRVELHALRWDAVGEGPTLAEAMVRAAHAALSQSRFHEELKHGR